MKQSSFLKDKNPLFSNLPMFGVNDSLNRQSVNMDQIGSKTDQQWNADSTPAVQYSIFAGHDLFNSRQFTNP